MGKAIQAPKEVARGILSYFTRHATAANLLLVVLIAFGAAMLPQMRAQFFPDVVVDEVRVNVSWSGAGAEDVDSAIVQLLEPSLLTVDGVTASTSRATEGRARITLEFEPGWDMMQALDDVQSAVDSVSNLPDGAEEPSVTRSGWRDPVTDVVITGPVAIEQLARFADELVARLYAEGVTRTSVQGVVAPRTLVEVTSEALVRHDLTMAEIASAIAAETAASPAGNVASGAARVRTGVAKRSAEEIEAVVLRSNADGSTLTVGDVATVRVEGIDRVMSYFVGDERAVTVSVQRTAEGDAIGIQNSVEKVAADLMQSLPEGVEVDLIRTRAEVITARLKILLENGLMGLGLVLLLLFLFLNARIALWVAMGIPVSMLTAIGLMHMAGLTFNMISIFALIITLGIVVDDAIVVGEHADFRRRHRGEGPVNAAETAARRMFPPVFSATLTTIIAFYGLTAIGGRFGEMIADIPFTVITVLLASLMECFLILPNHLAHALTHSKDSHWYDWPSRQVNKGFRWVRDRIFRPLMVWVIRLRYPVLAAALLLLASQVALYLRGEVRFQFFDAPEMGSVTANFSMAPGTTRDDTLAQMQLVQQSIEEYGAELEEKYGRNPIDYVLSQIGGGAGRGLASAEGKDADQLGAVTIELIDADLRPYTTFEFVGELQRRVRHHPMVEELSFRGGRFGPGGDALDVELVGESSEVLKAAAEELKSTVARYPEVSAVEDSLAYDKEELVLELTPQGQALGFTIDGIGSVLRNRLGGIEAASYPDGLRSATIEVALPERELSADFLDGMMMRASAGIYVPLADIVTVTTHAGFSSVVRENGLRVVTVNGDIDQSDPARAEEINRALETEILPELAEKYGISTRMAGLTEQQNEFLSDAWVGLVLAMVGIYLTLAWIFSSWTRPLVVMAIIPFGLIGAIWGHYSWGVPMSMFSIVGLIGMVGIIINDSIVLVSTIDEYGQDRGLIPAIVDAVADRLRPVFLTTATTVLGLAPILYEPSSQAQFLKPTVITLTYGLGFGFVLVLLVVPAIVAMQEDLRAQFRALRRVVGMRHRAPILALTNALAGLAMLALFALSVVPVLLRGLPEAPFDLAGPLLQALGLFVAGSAAIAIVAWGISALVHRAHHRRHRPA